MNPKTPENLAAELKNLATNDEKWKNSETWIESEFSEDEIREIELMFSNLSEEWLDWVMKIISNSITKEAKDKLLELKKEAVELNSWYWYENLRENLDSNDIMQELLLMFDFYIDNKIKNNPKIENLSLKEKDTIKLILWAKFQNILSPEGAIWVVMQSVMKTAERSLGVFSGSVNNTELTKDSPSITKTYKDIKSIIDNFSKNDNSRKGIIDYLDSIMWDRFTKINESIDNDGLDFTDQNKLYGLLNWDSNIKENENIFKSITAQAENLWKKLQEWKELGTRVWDFVDELNPELSSLIRDKLWEIINRFPILGFLLSMVLWNEFLDSFISWKSKKRKDSVKNLLKLTDDSKSVVNWLSPSFKENLNPTNLELFFKYLDSKEITYDQDLFWNYILTWKPVDSIPEKLKSVFDLLKVWEDNILFTINNSWKDGDWKSFINKLNSLQKLDEANESKLKEDALKKAQEEFAEAQAEELKLNKAIASAKKEKEEVDSKIVEINAEIEKINTEISSLESSDDSIKLSKPIVDASLSTKKIELERFKTQLAELWWELEEKEQVIAENAEALIVVKEEKTENQKEIDRNDFLKEPLIITWLQKPLEIVYGWKDLPINIENNNIILWGKKYKISIKRDGEEQFNSIKFDKDKKQFVLSVVNPLGEWYKDSPIETNILKNLIADLIENNSHSISITKLFFKFDIEITLAD